jgi:hypothetical protein
VFARSRLASAPIPPLTALTANINRVTGTHTVYLEFSSGAAGSPPYLSLHYFNFPVS